MLRRQIERYGRWLLAIAGLAAIAFVAFGYILSQQNLTFPWQERYIVKAQFSSAPGAGGGLGQPVNVAGVEVGKVLGTELVDGLSVAELEIDPAKLPAVYRDARAMLVPRTPLKDMQVEVSPGTPSSGALPDGGVIPVGQTTPVVDSDELTAALDADTRDFFRLLIGDFERGTRGRGRDMRRLFRALGPTAEQAQRVTKVLADRDRELERLVHNLAVITQVTGRRDDELAGLVQDASTTVGALAREERALGASIEKLPATLSAARRTLDNATPFANELGAAATALQPTARRLPATLRAAAPLVKESGPTIRDRIRPFVRDAQPLVEDLRAATPALLETAPDLTNAAQVLNYVVNELAYNPPGDDEGYLYWVAWLTHNVNSVFSVGDAQGPLIRGLALFDCESAAANAALAPVLALLSGPLPECD